MNTEAQVIPFLQARVIQLPHSWLWEVAIFDVNLRQLFVQSNLATIAVAASVMEQEMTRLQRPGRVG